MTISIAFHVSNTWITGKPLKNQFQTNSNSIRRGQFAVSTQIPITCSQSFNIWNRKRHQNFVQVSNSIQDSQPVDQLSTKPAVLPDSSQKSSNKLKFSIFGLSFSLSGRLVLAIVPLLWASYSICLKWLYKFPWSINAAVFNLLRLSVGSLVVIPAFVNDFKKNKGNKSYNMRSFIRAGGELGFYTFIVNILQIIGLKYTTASRGAFLSQLSTVIVPLAAFAFGMEKKIGLPVIIASIISVFGVALLSLDSISAPFTWRGDGLLLMVAFLAAGFILRSKVYSEKIPSRPLVAFKVFAQNFYALLYSFNIFIKPQAQSIQSIFAGATPMLLFLNAALVIWAGFFVCFLSTELQIQGQKLVSASEAAIIFTSTPIWAAILAVPLGERFGIQGTIGALLILSATLMAGAKDFMKKKKPGLKAVE